MGYPTMRCLTGGNETFELYINGVYKCDLTDHKASDILDSIAIICNMDCVLDVALTTDNRVQVRVDENILEF